MKCDKRCGCCGLNVRTAAEWNALAHVGVQDFGPEVLEYKNCPCGNTLVLATQKGPSRMIKRVNGLVHEILVSGVVIARCELGDAWYRTNDHHPCDEADAAVFEQLPVEEG